MQFSILLLENNQEIFGRCNITSLSLTPGTRRRNVVERKWQAYVKRQLGDESQVRALLVCIRNATNHRVLCEDSNQQRGFVS